MNPIDAFKNLFVMAAVDGRITSGEIALLTERAVQWNISDEDFHEALEYAQSPAASMIIPPTKQERISLLSELIQLMAVDGKLAEIEKDLFAVAAAQMEITDAELNKLLDELLGDDSAD